VGTLIRLMAIVASAIVALGFVLFAADELRAGSETQQQALENELEGRTAAQQATSVPPSSELAREQRHGTLREAIDDANDVLLDPFDELVDSSNAWVARGIPVLLALLLYGVGLGMLANFLPKQRQADRDWRTA
jgi:hypothetical protein